MIVIHLSFRMKEKEGAKNAKKKKKKGEESKEDEEDNKINYHPKIEKCESFLK